MRWLTEPLATPRLVVRGVSGDGLTALIVLGVALVGCAGRKDTSGDANDSSSEVDPCVDLMSDDTVVMIPSAGDTPNLDASEEYGARWCEPGYVCYDSYILPSSRPRRDVRSGDTVEATALVYIAPDGITTQSTVADQQTFYDWSNTESGAIEQIWRPIEALRPATKYEVWRRFEDSRTGEQSSCFDLTLVTSPHGSPLSLPESPPPPMRISAADPHYLFGSYIHEGSGVWPDEGGPDYAIQFGEIIDGIASVRVAAMAGSEQSWCHATLDTVVAVDDNGRFQIPGVPWRGLGTGRTDPVHGSELQNLLAEPFTISGYLAPDGQNAIVTLDDVVLDYRLAGKGCDLHPLESFDVKCSDGEICCMDVSTGPTITTTFPLHTSIQQIAQDNCHPFCPTSTDNPDCTLP